MGDSGKESYKPIPLTAVKSEEVSKNYIGVPFAMRYWADYTAHRISSFHGRSLEIIPSGKVLWADEYGNPMGARSLKGAPITTPILKHDSGYPLELNTFGLKDSLAISQIDKVSDLMRKNGFPTERIISKYKLNEVLVDGQIVPIEDWKKSQYESQKYFWQKKPVIVNRPDGSRIESGQIEKYLNDNDYFVLERDYQVGERIADLGELGCADEGGVYRSRDGRLVLPTGDVFENLDQFKSKIKDYDKLLLDKSILGNDMKAMSAQQEVLHGYWDRILEFMENRPDYVGWVQPGTAFRKALNGVFNWVNIVNSPGVRKSMKTDILYPPGEFKPFDADKPEDIKRYFSHHLPVVMGQYLGRFHGKLKLSHGYPTYHNWTLAGTLIDLDSVKGESLGGKPITKADLSEDLGKTLVALGFLFNIPNQRGYISIFDSKGAGRKYYGYMRQIFKEDEIKSMYQDAAVEFFSAYFLNSSKENTSLLGEGADGIGSAIEALYENNDRVSPEGVKRISERVAENLRKEEKVRT